MPFAPAAPGVGAPPLYASPPPLMVDATAVGNGEDDVEELEVLDAFEVLLPDADVTVPFAAPVLLAAAAVIVIGIAEDTVVKKRLPLLTVRTLVTRNEVETVTETDVEFCAWMSKRQVEHLGQHTCAHTARGARTIAVRKERIAGLGALVLVVVVSV